MCNRFKDFHELFPDIDRDLGVGEKIIIDPDDLKKSHALNPLDHISPDITPIDMIDYFGRIKPFEEVTKSTGIELEVYKNAAEFMRNAFPGLSQK